MNIRNLKTKVVHSTLLGYHNIAFVRTSCRQIFWLKQVTETTNPVTCKNCLKVKR